jgi:hypothetical protein
MVASGEKGRRRRGQPPSWPLPGCRSAAAWFTERVEMLGKGKGCGEERLGRRREASVSQKFWLQQKEKERDVGGADLGFSNAEKGATGVGRIGCSPVAA